MARQRIHPKKPRFGGKPDKIMRDLLALDLAAEMSVRDDVTGKMMKLRRGRLLVRALVNEGIKGDIDAIELVFNRMDGKLTTPISGPNEGPVQLAITREEAADKLAKSLGMHLGPIFDPEDGDAE